MFFDDGQVVRPASKPDALQRSVEAGKSRSMFFDDVHVMRPGASLPALGATSMSDLPPIAQQRRPMPSHSAQLAHSTNVLPGGPRSEASTATMEQKGGATEAPLYSPRAAEWRPPEIVVPARHQLEVGLKSPPPRAVSTRAAPRRRLLARKSVDQGLQGLGLQDVEPLAPPAATPWRERVREELAEAAGVCGWRLANAEDGTLVGDVAAQAVVVADLGSMRSGSELVRRLSSEAGRRRAPIVAFLCPESLDEDEGVLQAQRDFLGSGAGDVVLLQPSGNTALCMKMSVARTQHQRCAMRNFEAKMVAACEEEVAKHLEELKEERVEPNDGLFWQCAHKVFNGLPPLEWDIGASPSTGSSVGSHTLERQVGQGAFGLVYAAQDAATGAASAVKVLDKGKLNELDDIRNVSREIQVLRGLDHPNIVRLREALHSVGNIFIIMEYVGNAHLKKAITAAGGRMHIGDARAFFSQLMGAVSHCHDKSVAHRDIKPENIGVTSDGSTLKLLDFGSAVPLNKPCRDMAGTMPFMSPEILRGADTEPYVPSGCDVWAAGVVLLEMLCGFGKLNTMLGWDVCPEPVEERAAELGAYFEDFDQLHESLELDLGQVDEILMDLLVGVFQLESSHRWTASKTMRCEWLADGE